MRFLVIILILSSFPINVLTQEIKEESLQEYNESKRRVEDYKNHLTQYYKSKSAEEIWQDYIYLRMKTGLDNVGLGLSSGEFKEPFKSWAIEIFLAGELPNYAMGSFLVDSYPDRYKYDALEKYISITGNRQAELIIDLMPYINSWAGNEKWGKNALWYRNLLVERILNNPDVFNLPNSTLAKLFFPDSPYNIQIAQIIFNKNPSSIDLMNIINADVDFYSFSAKQILEEKNTWQKDEDSFSQGQRFDFLREIMKNWPN